MAISDICRNINETCSDIEEDVLIASSVDDYIRICVKIARGSNDRIWFRGHNERHALLPSLYRMSSPVRDARGNPVGPDFHGYSEGIVYQYRNFDSMMNAFKRTTLPYLKREPIDDFEWMFMMQHYGVPTRLLDWSTDPLVSLFFATLRNTDDHGKYDDYAEVWICDPKAINEKCHNIDGVVHLSERDWPEYLNGSAPVPICAYASHIDERIRAQSGVFTLHGNLLKPLSYYDFISKDFFRILIPENKIHEIFLDLGRLGYTYAKLFPSIESIALSIKDDETKRFNDWNNRRPSTEEILKQEARSEKDNI